jgi:hypothetical protein
MFFLGRPYRIKRGSTSMYIKTYTELPGFRWRRLADKKRAPEMVAAMATDIVYTVMDDGMKGFGGLSWYGSIECG